MRGKDEKMEIKAVKFRRGGCKQPKEKFNKA